MNEMLHNAAFHQGLHCLLRQIRSSEKEIQYFLEIITCNPSIYTKEYHDLTVLTLIMEKSIDLERVTSHINCIVARCLINVVYLTACAFIRS